MLESSLILSWDYKNAILLRMEVSKQPAGRQRRMSDAGVLVFAFIPIHRAGQGHPSFCSPLLGQCTSTHRAEQRTSQEEKEDMPELM